MPEVSVVLATDRRRVEGSDPGPGRAYDPGMPEVRGNRLRPHFVALAACALLSLWLAAPARGAEVRLGADLGALSAPLGLQPGCGSEACTFLQIDGPTTVSPVNGVITSWSFRTYAAQPSRHRLRVLSGLAGVGLQFTAVRSTEFAPAVSDAGVHEVPASLPISAGERIALGGIAGAPGLAFVNTPGEEARLTWATGQGGPPDGGTAVPESGPAFGVIGLAATVSYCQVPKVKGRKLKAAKRVVRAAGCRPEPKKRRAGSSLPGKKLGRVFRQRPSPGATVAPDTAVKLFFRR